MRKAPAEGFPFRRRSGLSKNPPTEGFGGKESVKGNRHTESQRGVSERNRRNAAALGAEMGFLSRSITRVRQCLTRFFATI